MVLCLLISAFLGISSFLFAIWFVLRADADLQLLFWEKYSHEKKLQLAGKVIWITGASSGIGEYLSYNCAQQGAKLIISGTDRDKLERVKSNCLAFTTESNILVLPFLVQECSVHVECVEKVIEHFGHIDVLVNNAGISQKADFLDVDIEVDRKLFDINVFGAVNLTRKVVKHFLERNKGQIVVTSSITGKLGAPFSCSYTASKHALHGYFEALRTELAPTNITVTIVCPGPVVSALRGRCVTGKMGEIYEEQQPLSSGKMETDRCSYLVMVALVNQLDESWICKQPILLLYYLSQYAPTIFRSLIIKRFFSKERVNSYRSGQK